MHPINNFLGGLNSLPIFCNWKDFIDGLPVEKYIGIIDEAARLPGVCLMRKRWSFGDVGLDNMAKTSSNVSGIIRNKGNPSLPGCLFYLVLLPHGVRANLF